MITMGQVSRREEKMFNPMLDRLNKASYAATAVPKVAIEGSVFCDRFKDGTIGPKMVTIPAGTFTMGDVWGGGDSAETPAHQVRLTRSFALGKYAVTFDEYDRFVKATGRTFPLNIGLGRGRRPVTDVSWNDAVAYCEWLAQQTGQQYRLPTEAEWEYAAQRGDKGEKWAGASIEARLGEYAWYGRSDGGNSHPVGEKQPNGLGLYDMSGNVWEWCRDWNDSYSQKPVVDPVGPDSGSYRVLRGGCWRGPARGCRSVSRSRCAPGLRYDFLGFRLARDYQEYWDR